MAEKENAPTGANPVEAFADASLRFVRNTGNNMVEASGNDPDVELIRANVDLVENHLNRVFETIKSQYSGTNIAIKRQIDEFLGIADGVGLAQSGERTAISVIKKGIFGGGFFSWISKHLAEIKKIIGFIFSFFGGTPKWVQTILDLIDQLWNMIVELLSGLFGFNKREIARDLSWGEVNYLNELAAVARLSYETQRLSKLDEE